MLCTGLNQQIFERRERFQDFSTESTGPTTITTKRNIKNI